MSRLGIQLYMVLDQFQQAPDATLERLVEIGYEEIEAIGGLLGVGVLRRMVERAELACPSVHMPFATHATEVLLEEACLLGAQYVVSPVLFPCDSPRDDTELMYHELNRLTADDFRRIADRANEIGTRAKRTGLRYVYHNHNFEFRSLGAGINGYSILLTYTDPELVCFEADFGWMAVAGVSPMPFLRTFPGRFPLLHIKDFECSGAACTSIGVCPRSIALGHGKIDYGAILQLAIERGAEHIFVEQDQPLYVTDSLEAAEQDYRYLDLLLASGIPQNETDRGQ